MRNSRTGLEPSWPRIQLCYTCSVGERSVCLTSRRAPPQGPAQGAAPGAPGPRPGTPYTRALRCPLTHCGQSPWPQVNGNHPGPGCQPGTLPSAPPAAREGPYGPPWHSAVNLRPLAVWAGAHHCAPLRSAAALWLSGHSSHGLCSPPASSMASRPGSGSPSSSRPLGPLSRRPPSS